MRLFSRILGLSLLFFLLVGCEVRERTALIYDEWGRGRLIGHAERGSEIGIVARPSASQYAIARFETSDILVEIYNADSHLDSSVRFSPNGTSPRQLQLLDGRDDMTAVWLADAGGGKAVQVQTIGWDGQLTGATTVIEGSQESRWHKSAILDDESHLAMWISDDGDLFGAISEGETVGSAVLLEADVVNADFAVDNEGQGRLVYSSSADGSSQLLNYALFDKDSLAVTEQASGFQLYGGDGADRPSTIRGPFIALENGDVYVTWNRPQRTPAGSFLTMFYSSFGLTESAESVQSATDPKQLSIPPSFPPFNVPAVSNTFSYSKLASLLPRQGIFGQAYPNTASVALPVQGDETVFTTTIVLKTRSDSTAQPALIYMKDGQPLGYQILTQTTFNSGKLAIDRNDNNELYVAWTDGSFDGDKPTYVMSTSPSVRDGSLSLTGRDYQVIAFAAVNRMAQAVVLIFAAIPWIIVPFFWFIITIWYFNGRVYDRIVHIVFLVGILASLLNKYITGGVLLNAIPNGGLLDPTYRTILYWGMPLAIMLFSLGITWLVYIRKEGKNASAAQWFIIAILLDYIFSLLYYSLGYFE